MTQKRTGKWILAFLILLIAGVCPFSNPKTEAATKVSITKNVTVNLGEHTTIRLKNNKKSVKWSVQNKKIIRIYKKSKTKALIKPLKKGKTKVTAKIGKKKYNCTVTVKDKVSMAKKANVTLGRSITVKLKNNTKAVKWSLSNKKVLSIVKKSKTQIVLRGLRVGTAKVQAAVGKKKYQCIVTVKKQTTDSNQDKDYSTGQDEISEKRKLYSYKITPILAPFNEYFYVETEDPNPSDICFFDKSSIYYTSEWKDYLYPCENRFLDVVYENEKTGRVKNGYIFTSYGETDGGTLEVRVWNKYRYEDTGMQVECPIVKDNAQYLIENIPADATSFFDKVGNIEKQLEQLALYPRGTVDTSSTGSVLYPVLAASPYKELSLNEHYDMYPYSKGGLLINNLYPYLLDSLGFPGVISKAAKRLDSLCVVSQDTTHYLVNVTYNGETKKYGGAGSGGRDNLPAKNVEKLFTFDGSGSDFAKDVSLSKLVEKRKMYDIVAAEFMAAEKEKLSGDTIAKVISSNVGGSWIRIGREGYSYETKAYAYMTRIEGYNFEHAYSLEDVWVDGRYVNKNNYFEQGAVFADHPNASIVVRNQRYTGYDDKESIMDYIYDYDEETDTWNFRDGDNLLTLTREQVEAMNVDQNKDQIPASGFIYDGSAEPGTPF
ncbi:MAG: hypothetical protein Q4B70_07705 [Lachnospiraceae bacterium]|nr:hypothetical protein [Lachnospiraceae bacterium]